MAFDLRAALTQELNAALEELNTPEGGPKAIHRCRVRLKRARALGRVGEVVAPGLATVFDDSARAAMHELAPVRELAALSDSARMHAQTVKSKHASALLKTADSLEAARLAALEFDRAPVRLAIRDLIALAQVWPEPSARQIRAGAKRVLQRARRARWRGQGAKQISVRHEWRKREKDRLYAAMLLDSAWPAPRRRKQGDALTHALGLERDAFLLLLRLKAHPDLAGDPDEGRRAVRVLRKKWARLRRRADKLASHVHRGGA